MQGFTEAVGVIWLVFFVTIFSMIKIILKPSLRKFKRAVASIFVGIPTGILSGLIASEWGAEQYTAIAVGCVFSLLSENILLFIMSDSFLDSVKGYIRSKIK